MVILKSPAEIETIRNANRIVAEILGELKIMLKPGITTRELDQQSEILAGKKGAKPAFKGYRGYPFSLCASVNAEVVHGMPSDRVLKDGILSDWISEHCTRVFTEMPPSRFPWARFPKRRKG